LGIKKLPPLKGAKVNFRGTTLIDTHFSLTRNNVQPTQEISSARNSEVNFC